MREIKFRGKTNGDTGAWVIGYYHYDKNIDKHFICSLEKLIRYEVIEETIGQFIWKYDRNGIELFEGDVLCTWNDNEEYDIWDKEEWGYTSIVFKDGRFGYSDWYMDDEGSNSVYAERFVEKIGNVFDNVGLLESNTGV